VSGINWNILANAPDPGEGFAKGIQSGLALGQHVRQQNALAAFARAPSDPASVNALLAVNPDLGFKAAEYQQGLAKREAMGRLFDPTASASRGFGANAPATQPGDAATPPPPLAMNPDGSAPAQGGPVAPAQVVDPSRLPPRTDGLRLNQDALRDLYRLDPESAIKVQQSVFNAGQAQFKSMRQAGETFASMAFHLRKLPQEQRAAELEAMAPTLMEMGVAPDMLQRADLSDTGLDRNIAIGRSIASLIDDDRADRRLEADVADDEADNKRADRNTESLISDRVTRRGLTARGQNIASADRRRGQDVASNDRRRNQDMTDRRTRESAGFQGGGRRGRRGGNNPPTATNPQTGEQLVFRAGKWVPAK
jgi:hypothetical protein